MEDGREVAGCFHVAQNTAQLLGFELHHNWKCLDYMRDYWLLKNVSAASFMAINCVGLQRTG